MAHLPIWYIQQIPQEICDATEQDFVKLPVREATMGPNSEAKDTTHRDTKVAFVPKGHTFEKYMSAHATQGNTECKWAYIIHNSEAIQYAEYGPSQHYNWHVDVFPLSGMGTDRKLTVICLLNDPSEFTGGELQIRLYQEYTVPLVKGTMIAFPSILEHRVTPVVTGVRKTATMWFNGPRFA